MTIAGWIVFGLIAGMIMTGCIAVGLEGGKMPLTLMVGVLLSVILLVGMWAWFHNTERGQRLLKTQESDFHGGLNRTVEVYDAVGNLIRTYSGKFDVDYNSDRIIFDDENGKRHVIYYPTGIIVIDENGESNNEQN